MILRTPRGSGRGPSPLPVTASRRTAPPEGWFVVKVTAAVSGGYAFDEWHIQGDGTWAARAGGRTGGALNPGVALDGVTFEVGDFAFARAADAAGGNLFELLPLLADEEDFGPQDPHTVFAGPASGTDPELPEFRPLVPDDYPVFGASGKDHSRGAVPDPGSKAGTTRVLHEDGSWGLATIDTAAADKTQIDRVSSASLAVDSKAVVTLSVAKRKSNHPYTADGVMVTDITEEDPVASDSSLLFGDTTTVRVAPDAVAGEVYWHVKAPVEVLAADYTLVDADDRGRLLTFTGTRTLTLPDPVPDFPDGWFCDVESRDAVLTITRETAATIDGAATVTVPAGQGVRLFSDGTQWFTQRGLMRQVSGPSRLWGSGASFSKSGGPVEEIDLGDRLSMAGKAGTTLTYTPDLKASGTPPSLDVDKVTGISVDGDNLRITVERRTVEFPVNAAGEQLPPTIGKAATVNVDVDRCSVCDGCGGGSVFASVVHLGGGGGIVLGGFDGPDVGLGHGGIVLGGFDGPDVGLGHGGIVVGGLTDDELSDLGPGGTADLDGPTVDSVTGDGASGASPYTVQFAPAVSGGIPDADGGVFTYAWSFPGASPSSSTAYKPTVTFTGAGTHNWTLVVTDGCGNASSTFNGSVTVS